MPFCVYILYSPTKNKYYVGSCENIEIRLGQHNSGRNLSTKFGVPWELVKTETFEARSAAVKREAFIKKMKSKAFIKKIIDGER